MKGKSLHGHQLGLLMGTDSSPLAALPKAEAVNQDSRTVSDVPMPGKGHSASTAPQSASLGGTTAKSRERGWGRAPGNVWAITGGFPMDWQ